MKLGGNWQTAPGRGDLRGYNDPQDEVPIPPCPRCGEEHDPKRRCPVG